MRFKNIQTKALARKRLLMLFLGLFGLSLMIYQCEQHVWTNPYSGDLESLEWAPQALIITHGKVNEAILSWPAVDKNIEGYEIYCKYADSLENEEITVYDLNESNEIPFKKIVTLDKEVTTFTYEEVIPDSSLNYFYMIYAFAGEHKSAKLVTSFKPEFPAPTNLRYAVMDRNLASLMLNWNDNSEGEDGFLISRKLGDNTWTDLTKLNENTTQFVDQIPPGMLVRYKIVAFKGECESPPLYRSLQISETKSLIFGGNKMDELNSVCRTPNYGYIAVGSTTSTDWAHSIDDSLYINSKNGLLIEFDRDLSIRGIESYGGTGNDSFEKVIAVSDGIILFGKTTSTDFDCIENSSMKPNWVMKLDYQYNIIWSNFFEYELSNLKALSNDNIVLCGKKNNDGWVLILDNQGQKLVDKTFGGDGKDWFNNLLVLKDSILLVGARSGSNWLVKMNISGDQIWSNVYGNEGISGEGLDVQLISYYSGACVAFIEKIVLLEKYSIGGRIALRILDIKGKEVGVIKLDIPDLHLDDLSSMIGRENILLFNGNTYIHDLESQWDPYSSIIKVEFQGCFDPDATLLFNEQKLPEGYLYSYITDHIFSIDGNCLSIGEMWKPNSNIKHFYYYKENSYVDGWIFELDINTGEIVQ